MTVGEGKQRPGAGGGGAADHHPTEADAQRGGPSRGGVASRPTVWHPLQEGASSATPTDVDIAIDASDAAAFGRGGGGRGAAVDGGVGGSNGDPRPLAGGAVAHGSSLLPIGRPSPSLVRAAGGSGGGGSQRSIASVFRRSTSFTVGSRNVLRVEVVRGAPTAPPPPAAPPPPVASPSGFVAEWPLPPPVPLPPPEAAVSGGGGPVVGSGASSGGGGGGGGFHPGRQRECAICLDSFQTGEVLRMLPCQHRFHSVCLDQWLTGSVLCPLCKHSVVDA